VNNKWMRLRWTVAVLLMALALAACSSGGGSAGPEPLDVTVKADNTFKYDPTTLSAKVGQTLKVTLANSGALDHTFLIDELGVNSGTVAPGQSGTVSFTPNKAGTYSFYCNVAGHKEGGMVGTLTVTEP
jgi:uncharacterized cupredoxin-like copper-binding protein